MTARVSPSATAIRLPTSMLSTDTSVPGYTPCSSKNRHASWQMGRNPCPSAAKGVP